MIQINDELHDVDETIKEACDKILEGMNIPKTDVKFHGTQIEIDHFIQCKKDINRMLEPLREAQAKKIACELKPIVVDLTHTNEPQEPQKP